MTSFFETETSITASQIQSLESELGFKFPDEYKNHLIKFNGGRCEPNVFTFEENGTTTESNVDWFLALYDGEFDNLKSYFDIYKVSKKRMPEAFFPIAHDPGGNLVCMDKSNNKIYFWDHELEVNYDEVDDNYRPNISFVANCLTEFIDNLR